MKKYLLISILIVISGCKDKSPQKFKTSNIKKTDNSLVDSSHNGKSELDMSKLIPFKYYQGPTIIPPLKPGDKVWGPVPLNKNWEVVNYAISTVKKIKEDKVLLYNMKSYFVVPGAILVKAVKPEVRLKRGATVLVSIGLSSEFAKVNAVKKKYAQVRLIMGKEEITKEVKLDSLKILDEKKYLPGSPVSFKNGRKWEYGQLIFADKKMASIIGFAGKVDYVPVTSLSPIPFTRTFPKNRWVWSPWYNSFQGCKVLKVINKGVGYLIEFSGKPIDKYNNPRIVSFSKVTFPK
jgi:hypothetical protein